MAFKGIGRTRGPYLVAMILYILVGACGPAMTGVDGRLLAV